MNHHTKDKGDVGVLKAQADLASKGFMVLKPQTEHAPFDLVIYKRYTFRRVQVKYRSLGSRGGLDIYFRSSWSDRHGVHTRQTDKSQIDLYCVYCPDIDECLYFDPKRFGRYLCLRVKPPRNNQKRNVKNYSDFLKVP